MSTAGVFNAVTDVEGVRVGHFTDLEHLTGITNLQELCLGKTLITDAGLVHLRGLTKLRQITPTIGWP